ncbi:MAG: threonine--tRNA ligase [Bacteriovoracaceae bacterium]|nr:threonine--tRNA ligase [Bacteriovoracaceae bacterium]
MAKYDISTVRHSMAHLMAQSIQQLFPNEQIQFGIGPTIENGFYYDIEMEYRLTEDDLKKIEVKMLELIKAQTPLIRRVVSREEALSLFSGKNQDLKVELIKELPEGEEISCYEQGDFIDLCRGPHVENTGELPRFVKVMHTAGAYWRGDSDRQMLQRIYATCFNDKKQLKEYLTFLEEAKKRDHRKLGKELELFVMDPSAPASPFFMPKGAFVYNELIEFMRRILKRAKYDEVITPQIADSALWHTSGHYDHYKENMFFTNIDKREFAVKPMNCPMAMMMFKHFKHSYRELPLRYADFGRIHRYEKSGSVSGLTRVRTFVQDDAHIFVTMDQVQQEIRELMDIAFMVYEHFNFTDVQVNLSTRPEKRCGDDATWDKAEGDLKAALDASGRPYEIDEGDGAFYGPKIDIKVFDALKRSHQLTTIQLDFQLPERFDLKYTEESGDEVRPVVIHRAILGSIERFFGILLEHVAGAYPFWIAPEQAVIVPIKSELHLEHCKKIQNEFEAMGFRVRIDDRNESMGFKTRQIQKAKIPFMIAVGDKEIEEDAVNLRAYGAKYGKQVSLVELKAMFLELNAEKLPKGLR